MNKLLEEIRRQPNSGDIRYILMKRGCLEAMREINVIQRAYMFSSVIKGHSKVIYRNDKIAGSMAGLFCDAFGEEERKDAENFLKNFGVRNFLQNTDHYSSDYEKLLRAGVPGLFKEIKSSRAKYAEEREKKDFLRAAEICLQAFKDMLAGYREKCEALIGTEGYNERELRAMSEDLGLLCMSPPKTFRQALQLVWAWHLAYCLEGKFAMALGRMDQYLYPFYKADLRAGRITPEEACALLESVFIKIGEWRYFIGMDDVANICIAGVDRNGDDASNELSFLIIEAVKNCNIPGPNLSARISEKTPDSLLDAALVSVGTGLGYPALMNDEVNRASLKRHGFDEKDVNDYTMVGCIENFLTGKQPPWTDGRYNTPLCLEFVMYNGRGMKTERTGAETGDVSEIETMDEFMRRLEVQMKHLAQEEYLLFRNTNDMLNPVNFQQPFLSMLCEDCIGRGLDVNMGGAKYPANHGFGIMGIGTVADSLAAIERVVFSDKKVSLSEIRDAMRENFVGYEGLQKLLDEAPKYGNNSEAADKYAVWLVRTSAKIFDEMRTPQGGKVFCGMASNTANISAGHEVGATPDGRKSGEPLSEAASPTYGKDCRGATETVNSIVKPDYTKVSVGSVVNQKFSPVMFTDPEKRKKLLALIRVYFSEGGQEMQINATSRETLIDAMNHPEKYPNLIVRVSGFSAYYVTLCREVQQDILNRTQQR